MRHATNLQVCYWQTVSIIIRIVLLCWCAYFSFEWHTQKNEHCTLPEYIVTSHWNWTSSFTSISFHRVSWASSICLPSKLLCLTVTWPGGSYVRAPPMISQPAASIFFCHPQTYVALKSQVLSTLWRCLPAISFVFPIFLLPSHAVPCKMVFVRPDGRGTCPYHFSVRLFTVVRGSSWRPMACWIMLRTSTLATWSVYKIRRIFR